MISDYFNIAWKNLRKRKLRSWLTMIGIIISIATIFVLISLSIGLQNAVEEQFRLLGSDKFFIQPKGQLGAPGTGGAVELTLNDVKIVEKSKGVKEILYMNVGNGKVEFEKQSRYFMVAGISLETMDVYIETGSLKVEEGKMLEKGEKGKVMLGSYFKHNNLFKKPVRAGDKILINGKEFEVASILEPIGNPSDDQNVIMSFEDAQELFNIGDRVDAIVVQIKEGEDINLVAEDVGKKLRKSRGVTEKTQDFSISTPEELLKSFGTILNIITAFLSGIAAISLLVGGIGIMNTMYTSVVERTREIGVMKAIGARNKDIMLIFLIESGLLGLVGGILGVLLGMGAGKLVEFIALKSLGTDLLRVAFPAYLIIGCLGFAFLIGAVSGTFPAWKASKTNVIEALRYE